MLVLTLTVSSTLNSAALGPSDEEDYHAMRSADHYRSWDFLDALGQLRGVFGVHVAMIATRYDLDVQGDLQSILPPEPRDHDLDR